MLIREEVSSDKLRGGFYTPENLVRFCWTRIENLTRYSGKKSLKVLEPSAVYGNFFRFLTGHDVEERIHSVHAIELIKEESKKCKHLLREFQFDSKVINGSILNGSRPKMFEFDVAIGNPPYLRYQFIDDSDRNGIDELTSEMGLQLKGVSNLWIPVLLAALNPLRIGGAFAFVIPTEFLTGISAQIFREWVVENVSNLQLDFFPPESFPGVLQEVLVFSGTKQKPKANSEIQIIDNGRKRKWKHRLELGHPTWTHLYLPPDIWRAVEDAKRIAFTPLSKIAKLSVSTVTGANQFFCVNDEILEKYSLKTWAKPLLPKSRFVSGLVSNSEVVEVLKSEKAPRWLLDFSTNTVKSKSHAGLLRYLKLGEELGLSTRYKTRIRNLWYEVPVIRPGKLLLSKRSHYFPRLLLNKFGHHTTDTIYTGNTIDGKDSTAKSLVGTFHNSLTLLTSELEGRSFGGGVLELVPSEVARLVVPNVKITSTEFNLINKISKNSHESGEELIAETNKLIASKLPDISNNFFENLESARKLLLSRRIERI
jgi:adenine-specific DNA methylase